MKPKTISDHGVPRQIPGRGPNGRRFCRWCHLEVPKGRSSYCGSECMQHCVFNYSKLVVFSRDEKTCQMCQCKGRTSAGAWPRDLTLPKLEADHIVGVKEGGSHHPDNLRTLCHACHVKRTTEQRRERKRAGGPR